MKSMNTAQTAKKEKTLMKTEKLNNSVNQSKNHLIARALHWEGSLQQPGHSRRSPLEHRTLPASHPHQIVEKLRELHTWQRWFDAFINTKEFWWPTFSFKQKLFQFTKRFLRPKKWCKCIYVTETLVWSNEQRKFLFGHDKKKLLTKKYFWPFVYFF